MSFVFSSWFIVLAILLVAIAGLVTGFVLMDRKDKKIIAQFTEENSVVGESTVQEPTTNKQPTNKE